MNSEINELNQQFFYKVFDVFDKQTIDQLNSSCDKHFNENYYVKEYEDEFDPVLLTNSIMDCHGLHLTGSLNYPYEEEWWNTFVYAAKKEIIKYGEIIGINPKIICPFACWALRMTKWNEDYHYEGYSPFTDMKVIEDDVIEFGKEMISVVYYLKTPDNNCGFLVESKKDYYTDTAKQNSFFIFKCSNLHSPILPSPDDLKISPFTAIVFNFFINEPYSKPAWEDTILIN